MINTIVAHDEIKLGLYIGEREVFLMYSLPAIQYSLHVCGL